MEEDVPNWLIPNKFYDVCKWIGLIVLPAVALFFGTVAQAWGLDPSIAQSVVITVNALGTCIGAVIGVTTHKSKGGETYD